MGGLRHGWLDLAGADTRRTARISAALPLESLLESNLKRQYPYQEKGLLLTPEEKGKPKKKIFIP